MTHNSRIEALEKHLAFNSAVDLMRNGALMVVEGGIEGIQDAAQQHPEKIIEAIVLLTSVIEMMQEERNKKFEEHLQMLDEIEKIKETFKK